MVNLQEQIVDLKSRVERMIRIDNDSFQLKTSQRQALKRIKKSAKSNMADAMMDDMEGHVIAYQKRIILVDKVLKGEIILN